MGVRCSLLGHDYGDPDVERERDEDGTEVVLRAKRVERCRNCGHERTVAENTEVTTLSAAAGVVRNPDGTVVVAPDADGGVAVGDGGETDDAIDGSAPGGSIADSLTADSALDRPTDATVQTSVDEPRTPDGIGDTAAGSIDRISDADATEPATGDRPRRAPGEWPAEPATDRASKTAREGAADVTATGTGTTDSGRSRTTDGSFACGSCGFSAAVADSPLRAGDICPDCGVGYLAQETRKG